jgi:small ligand-binding sensory domain FIST
MPFAAALSEHPLATHAVGEVVGEVLEALGPAPDIAVLFVGVAHTGALEDIAGAVRDLLRPRILVACTTGTVVGGAREVEELPALSLWAGRLPRVTAFRLEAAPTPEGWSATGFPRREELAEVDALLLVTDPFTFPVVDLLDALQAEVGPGVPIVGGQASAALGPGGNRLVLDGEVHTSGAVALAFGGVDARTLVSQGCRPIGEPMVVTRGRGSLIEELAGRAALERVQEAVRSLGPADAQRAQQGLHVGRVVDEHKVEYERGDFLVRSLRGADRRTGAVAVDDELEVGATVQLQVRDADSAREDLLHLLAGQLADTALLFTCNGRGTHLFGVEDHDAQLVSEALGQAPVAGMSCAGEIGPIGGRSFLHTFTASVLLLSDRG